MKHGQPKVIPFPGIENAYIIISARMHATEPGWCVAVMSFVYIKGDIAVEWEPNYGPIQCFTKATAEEGRRHYIFDYVTEGADWSQIAVYSNKLPQAFVEGDYNYIFAVLARWAS